MNKWKCKKCGRICYSYFCLNCDSNFWKYSWRRYFIQTWVPGVLLCIAGVLLNVLTDISGSIHWTVWGIGIALIIAAMFSTFPKRYGWGLKLVKRQFGELDDRPKIPTRTP